MTDLRDFQVKDFQHTPFGIIFKVLTPTGKFTSLGAKLVVVSIANAMLFTSVLVVHHNHLAHR